MMKTIIVLAAIGIGGMAWAQAPAPSCGTGEIGVTASNPSAVAIGRVRAGGACRFTVRSDAWRVETPPRNGTVVVEYPYVIYRPNPGFRGQDVFRMRTGRAGRTIDVTLTVE